MTEQEKTTWAFDLSVYGPFQVSARSSLEDVEVFFSDDVFFESIDIKTASHGASFSFKAQAETSMLATQVALFAVEQMLNVLAIQVNYPLFVAQQETRPLVSGRGQPKRVMEKNAWQRAFREAHLLLHREPAYLQALGKYRNALCLDNPVERFVSFFQSMEQIILRGQRNNVPSAEGRLDCVYDGFQRLWKERASWPYFLQEEGKWEEVQELYILCSEGVVPLLSAIVTRVCLQLEVLHRAAHAFLIDWRNQQISLPGEFYHTGLHLDTGWGHILH